MADVFEEKYKELYIDRREERENIRSPLYGIREYIKTEISKVSKDLVIDKEDGATKETGQEV